MRLRFFTALLFSQLILSTYSLVSYSNGFGQGYFHYILCIAAKDPVQCTKVNYVSNVKKYFEVDCSDTVFDGIVRVTFDILPPQLLGITFNPVKNIANFTRNYETIMAKQELVKFGKWGMVAKDLQIVFDRVWSAEFKQYILETWGKYCDMELSVSGHGFGSCLAQMMSVKIWGEKYWPAEQMFFIGYATPRCGNEDFAYYVDQSVIDKYRVNWKADPIPQYPTTTCTRDGKAQLGRCTDSWYHCCTQLHYRVEKNTLGKNVTKLYKCDLPEDSACLAGSNPVDHYTYWNSKESMYQDVNCKGGDFPLSTA